MNSENSYQIAIKVLKEASFEHGFLASVQNEANYKRVWTRDSVICGLAALQTNDTYLVQTFKKALITIFDHQHNAGFFPSNVGLEDKHLSFGGPVGRTDNTSWAIIGMCKFLVQYPDSNFADRYFNSIVNGFKVLDAWEFNGKGLIYVPQSGNWADEYYQHGYLLMDQLLRVWALELAAEVYNLDHYKHKATSLRTIIEENFHGSNQHQKAYMPLIEKSKSNFPKDYWIGGFNPSTIYTNFDLLANSLAIYLKLGSSQIQEQLISFLKNEVSKNEFMIPSFSPTIEADEPDFNTLLNLHSFKFRNFPHQFHNGGLWPVWNGFLAGVIANTDKKLAEEIGKRVDHACKLGTSENQVWDFNECLNGKTNKPQGISKCSWSAAGLILSKNAFL